jgi:NADPH2:quinone reductase
MKAIYFEQTGDPQKVLAINEFSKPVAAAGEVLVKVIGSPINPSDIFFITGDYRLKPTLPQIAGFEGAGIIEAVGESVNLKPGSLVAFFSKNAWAEYVTVPQKELFVLPDDFPTTKAVQFALNPITAWGLLEKSGLKEGDWLLLTAGNSMVSKFLIEFAKRRKINLIATVRNAKYVAPLLEKGVAVINTEKQEVLPSVKELTGGVGVDCAMDPIGGKLGSVIIEALKPNGKLIIYGKTDPEPAQFHYSAIAYNNLTIFSFGIRGYVNSLTDTAKTIIGNSVAEIIGKPEFDMGPSISYPICDFQSALKAIQTLAEGKVILNCAEI